MLTHQESISSDEDSGSLVLAQYDDTAHPIYVLAIESQTTDIY